MSVESVLFLVDFLVVVGALALGVLVLDEGFVFDDDLVSSSSN
jgi:hypothetical protein